MKSFSMSLCLLLSLYCVSSVPACINVSCPPYWLLIYESYPGLSLLPPEGSIDGPICRVCHQENCLTSTNIMNILLTTCGLQEFRFRWSKMKYWDVTRNSALFHFVGRSFLLAEVPPQMQCFIGNISVAVTAVHPGANSCSRNSQKLLSVASDIFLFCSLFGWTTTGRPALHTPSVHHWVTPWLTDWVMKFPAKAKYPRMHFVPTNSNGRN